MRIVFGVLSLLIALAIVGVLAKKQLAAVSALPPVVPPGEGATAAARPATPQQQVQQVQQTVQGLVQQARPMPEEGQ